VTFLTSQGYNHDVAGRSRTPQLKKLLKLATPDQLRRARCAVLDHYDAVHAAGLLVESPERVALEALQVAMEDEPDLRPSKREQLEARNYAIFYSGGYGYDRP